MKHRELLVLVVIVVVAAIAIVVAVAAAAAAAAADISADRDDSITMPGALQASLRIRPPPLAFLDGADVPGWLRTTVIILLTLLTFS